MLSDIFCIDFFLYFIGDEDKRINIKTTGFLTKYIDPTDKSENENEIILYNYIYNTYGECNVPDPNTNFVAIAAGGEHSLGLKDDGSIVAWGKNNYGQCNVPSGNNFMAVSGGEYHSKAVRVDGSAIVWGWNKSSSSSAPAGNYVSLLDGSYHSIALNFDGSVSAWGYNRFGQCDVPTGKEYVAIAG